MPELTYERLHYLTEFRDPQPYSGRGMYGRQCLSVVMQGETPFALLAEIVEGCDDVTEAGELLRTARVDDMGLGHVVYWPGIRVPA